jgi:hypothetical protein
MRLPSSSSGHRRWRSSSGTSVRLANSADSRGRLLMFEAGVLTADETAWISWSVADDAPMTAADLARHI